MCKLILKRGKTKSTYRLSTKLSPKGMWSCNVMALSGKEEKEEVAFNGCGSRAEMVRGGGVKQRGTPKDVEEKLVLFGGIGRRRGLKNEEKSNFFYGSGSGARPVHGAAKKRARPEGSGKENVWERGVINILRGSGGVEKRARQKDFRNKGGGCERGMRWIKVDYGIERPVGGGDQSGERGMHWIKVDDGIERLIGGEENGGGDESVERGMRWIKVDYGIERMVAG